MALPPDAVVIVQVQDITIADAPARVIGKTEFITEGKQVPFQFEINYDLADINEGNMYSLSGRIEAQNGDLLFITDTIIPVITRGNPISEIEMILVPVGKNK